MENACFTNLCELRAFRNALISIRSLPGERNYRWAQMKEYVVTFNLLAEDNKEVQKIGESICSYFLADSMCTIESIRLKHPEPKKNKTVSKNGSDKSWLKTFGYTET